MSLNNLAKLIKQATEVQTPSQEFGQLLMKAIQEVNFSTRQPSQTYKPSSLGGCHRKIYFEVTGAEMDEERQSAELIGICDIGTFRHDNLQNTIMQMKDLGYDVEWIDVEEYLNS